MPQSKSLPWHKKSKGALAVFITSMIVSSDNDVAVRKTLIEIIEGFAATNSVASNSKKSAKSQSDKTKETSSQMPQSKSLPWHKKSKGALAVFITSMIVSAALFTGLILAGLLLTPWIILPFVFLIITIGAGIKIRFDNLSFQSAVTTQVVDNPDGKWESLVEETNAQKKTRTNVFSKISRKKAALKRMSFTRLVYGFKPLQKLRFKNTVALMQIF